MRLELFFTFYEMTEIHSRKLHFIDLKNNRSTATDIFQGEVRPEMFKQCH